MNGLHVFNETISYPGRQKVSEILVELEREQTSRKDWVVNSSKLKMEVIDDQMLLRVPNPKSKETLLLPLSNRVHSQIAQWMRLRTSDGFYKYCTDGFFMPKEKATNVERRANWQFFCDTFNGFAKQMDVPRMIRMLYNRNQNLYCRAFLSDGFQIIDTCDFFYTIVDKLQKMGAEVWHARLSDDRFFGYAVHPKTSAVIDLAKAENPNGHSFKSFARDGKDEIHPAMIFGNSETGEGGCFLRQALLWTYCVNYAVTAKVMNRTHIGRKRGEEQLLKPETIREENKVFFMKVGDIVESTFDTSTFQAYIKKLEGAHQEEVTDPEAAAEALRICYDISEETKASVRNLFLKSYPQTRYGLIGAVTQVGHSAELSADEGFNLEELGAKLIDTDLQTIITRSAKEKKLREETKELKLELAGV